MNPTEIKPLYLKCMTNQFLSACQIFSFKLCMTSDIRSRPITRLPTIPVYGYTQKDTCIKRSTSRCQSKKSCIDILLHTSYPTTVLGIVKLPSQIYSELLTCTYYISDQLVICQLTVHAIADHDGFGIPEFLDAGLQTLDSGPWTLDATLNKLGSGH